MYITLVSLISKNKCYGVFLQRNKNKLKRRGSCINYKESNCLVNCLNGKIQMLQNFVSAKVKNFSITLTQLFHLWNLD